MLEFRHSSMFSRVRALLDVIRLVRLDADLADVLAAIAESVAQTLGFRTVVVELYRPEWDDFAVATVHGSADAPDCLTLPLRGDDATVLGTLSVREPVSGCDPSADEVDVLVAVAEHAAIAVQAAQEAAQSRRHRDALERLLEVSTRLSGAARTGEILQLVSDAIADVLRFERVSVELRERDGDRYLTAASSGFTADDVLGDPLTVETLDRLLLPEFQISGCYLVPDDRARELLPERRAGYRSKKSGAGPHAWRDHWLLVPLDDARGRRVGYIWCDDPSDRLVPRSAHLQLLRTFANQATTALTTADHVEELQRLAEHQRALIDASPVAIMDIELDGRIRTWSRAATDMFGWSADEVVGRFSPMVPAAEHALYLRNLDRIAHGETLRAMTLTRLRRDGTPVEVEVSAGPLRNGDGEVVGVVSVWVDIRERLRWERQVRAGEARKDAILRSALDPLITVDGDGRIVEFSPVAEEVLGWTPDDAIGAEFIELAIAPEHGSELRSVLASGIGHVLGTRHELTALRGDGRAFPAELAANRVDLPGPPLYAVSLRDITKRKDREERLRDAEAKYRTLVEQIPLATYINETGLPVRTRYISPQVERLLGYPVSSWLQPDFFPTLLHPDDAERVTTDTDRIHRTGETYRDEYRLRHADGHYVWVRDETVAVRDGEYRPLFLQGFLLDVSDRHELEEELEALVNERR